MSSFAGRGRGSPGIPRREVRGTLDEGSGEQIPTGCCNKLCLTVCQMPIQHMCAHGWSKKDGGSCLGSLGIYLQLAIHLLTLLF